MRIMEMRIVVKERLKLLKKKAYMKLDEQTVRLFRIFLKVNPLVLTGSDVDTPIIEDSINNKSDTMRKQK